MQITTEDIQKVANLARLELNEQEIESMCDHVDKILNYVDKLNELDTSDIKPTTHALDINNAFREDIVVESLPQAEALQNSPKQNGEAFVVPKVIT